MQQLSSASHRPICSPNQKLGPPAGFPPLPSGSLKYLQEQKARQSLPESCPQGHHLFICIAPMPSLYSCSVLHQVYFFPPSWANIIQGISGLSVALHHAPPTPTAPKVAAAPVLPSTMKARAGTGQMCVNRGTSPAWHPWLPLTGALLSSRSHTVPPALALELSFLKHGPLCF